MATLKQRLHKKNSSGSYDTIHLETSSSLVLRPSGRSVEQDLADFLPEVQDNDNVPESLKSNKLVVGSSKAFILGKSISLGSTGIPSGIIAMWSGASDKIPSGWLLCNGSNGTPDLRNRFVVGAGDKYSVGSTGGSDSVTLSTDQIPSHTHTFTGEVKLSGLTCSSAGAHTHSYKIYSSPGDVSAPGGVVCAGYAVGGITSSSAGAHTHTISGSGTATGTNSNTGGGSSHENRPPYYALCYIMKQ